MVEFKQVFLSLFSKCTSSQKELLTTVKFEVINMLFLRFK